MSRLSGVLDRIRAIAAIAYPWMRRVAKRIAAASGWCIRTSLETPRRRSFVFNLLIGTVVVLILPFFPGAKRIDLGKDEAMDEIVKLRYEMGFVHRIDAPIALIDIDEDTYKDWGEPLVLQREYVSQLLDRVLAAQPKLVILDIDLAPRGNGGRACSGTTVDDEQSKSDRRESSDINAPIERTLKQYLEDCGKDCIPIVLVASLRCPVASPHLCETRSLAGLDRLIRDHRGHFLIASPTFIKDADGVVRNWDLWQMVCRGTSLDAIPSVSLIAANLLRDGGSGGLYAFPQERQMEEAPERWRNCHDGAGSGASKDRAMTWGADRSSGGTEADCPLRKVDSQAAAPGGCFSFRELRQPIIYGVRYSDYHKAWFRPIGAKTDETDAMLLLRIPAHALIEQVGNNAALDEPLCALKGRIVFIGGSYEEARDVHETPLGRMPGILIMINSLTSLLEHGDLSPFPWLEVPFLMFLVLGASVAFAYFRSTLLAALTVVVVVLLIVMLLGIFCVQFAIAGLNFGLPLLAMTLWQVILDLWEAFRPRRGM